MKISAFADIHSNTTMLEAALKEAKSPGLAVLLGDNTHYGGFSDAEKVLETMDGKKILALPGNVDTWEVLETFEKKGVSLHGKKKKISGFVFIGFGGGKTGDAGETNFEEAKIYSTLKALCKGEKKIVLCTHLPPINTKIDLTSSGSHAGSKAIRRIIEEFYPVLHLCGHCHESAGEEKIGKTLCINAGAVKEGNAVVIDLNEKSNEIKFERIKVF
ncbi:MAG: metallophosphoesterase family protein [Candidatus ainarchaeum sp.]|nr:metallophosphoesterase family protein [Candidatus ainarchaeum sp.]